MPQPFDVAAVRAQFPILSQSLGARPLVYLDNAASAQKPLAVLEAVRAFDATDYANIHRGVHTLSQRATRAYEAARVAVQRFLHAAHDHEVIFTRGTTESFNLLAWSWGRHNLGPSDAVILSAMEHHANIVPWQLLAQERGFALRVIPVLADGTLDLEAARALLRAPGARLLSVTHVSNALGTVNPVEELIEAAHAVGALVALDGAQAVPHLAVDVQALGCDFYAFSAHKLFGPTGVGVLYGRAELLAQMPPFMGGGDMIERVSFEGTTFAAPPARFEAGTPNITGAIGLAAALAWLQDLDLAGAHAHEAALLADATARLRAIPGIELVGTAPRKVPVLSFTLAGAHADDLGMILDQMGVAVRTGHHCAQPLMAALGVRATARASFAFYNTHQEVEALAHAVQTAARLLT
jgi:cysteine desulfurase/selenocysteine lyase